MSASGDAKKARILGAVLQLSGQRGVAHVSIGNVAAAAGVPKSVVLYHFNSRDELLDAALAAWLAPLQAALDDALEPRGRDPRDQLGAWLLAHFQGELDGWRMATQLALGDPASPAALRATAFDAAAERDLARLLSHGHQQLAWRAPRAQASAVAVRAVVEGVLLRAARAGAPLLSAHKVARQVALDLLVRG